MSKEQSQQSKGPTDKNAFDDWLKAKLHRDIIFRMGIWTMLALLAGYFAIYANGSTAIEFFERTSNSVTPLIRTFGVAVLQFCLLAVALKDIEVISICPKTVAGTKGVIGGFARRIAGDLSLWTLGAINALICALLLVFCFEKLTRHEVAIGLELLMLLVGLFIALAIGNVLVRRQGPSPLVSDMKIEEISPVKRFLIETFWLATFTMSFIPQLV